GGREGEAHDHWLSQRVRERTHCRRQRAIAQRGWVSGRTGWTKHPPPGALADAAGLPSCSLTWPAWLSPLLTFFSWRSSLLSHLLSLLCRQVPRHPSLPIFGRLPSCLGTCLQVGAQPFPWVDPPFLQRRQDAEHPRRQLP